MNILSVWTVHFYRNHLQPTCLVHITFLIWPFLPILNQLWFLPLHVLVFLKREFFECEAPLKFWHRWIYSVTYRFTGIQYFLLRHCIHFKKSTKYLCVLLCDWELIFVHWLEIVIRTHKLQIMSPSPTEFWSNFLSKVKKYKFC